MTTRKGASPQSGSVTEKQFESLVQAATDAILGIDHQGKITIWNKAATKIFGYSAQQAIGMDLHNLIVPDRMYAKAIKGFHTFVKTGEGPLIGKTTECVALHKDGTEFPVELSISGFKPNNHWHAVGIVRDISKRKQAEGMLRLSRYTIDHSSDEAFWVDQDANFVYVNERACQKLGYTRTELLNMNVFDIDPVFPRHSWSEHWQEIRKRGSFHLESVHKTKSGETFPVDICVNYVCFEGKEYNFSFISDITKRKQDEAAFQVLLEGAAGQTGEEFFGNIVNGIATWLHADCVILGEIYDHKIKAHTMVLDGKSVDNFSYPLAGTPCENAADKGFCAFQEGVIRKFPDDRDLSELGAEGYVGVSLTDMEGHSIGVLCAIFRNKVSFPAKMQEVFEIIAARAAAEMERSQAAITLREEREQSRQIIETARDAFVSMDADGIITDWNPRAEEMFGWTRDEALGKEVAETIIPEELHEAHTKGLAHYLATKEGPVLSQHIEITARYRDGHTFPVELSIVPAHSGDSVNFNAFIRDTTARLKAREKLDKSREQLRASLIGTVIAVSRAVGARDPYTAGHQQRVSQLSRAIAQEIGLDAKQTDGLRMGASIHDIGKIYLPAEILSKPTKLTDAEYALIKSHSQVGYDILKDVAFPWPIADIAHQHHERLDGTGYPQGLKGDEICLEARIVAVADVVEAMSSHRPYRAALGMNAALQEIEDHRGKWFDPAAVDACLSLCRKKDFSFK